MTRIKSLLEMPPRKRKSRTQIKQEEVEEVTQKEKETSKSTRISDIDRIYNRMKESEERNKQAS